MTITAIGGVSSPKAWKHAHSTPMSKAHQAIAPSAPHWGSRNTRSIAVRTPVAIDAGTVANCRAKRASFRRRCPRVHRATRRSKSSGSSETARKIAIAEAPKMAGTIVIAKLPPPWNTPVRRPTPKITSALMNTP